MFDEVWIGDQIEMMRDRRRFNLTTVEDAKKGLAYYRELFIKGKLSAGKYRIIKSDFERGYALNRARANQASRSIIRMQREAAKQCIVFWSCTSR